MSIILEKKINIKFDNKKILKQCLTHKSFDSKINYEKLEFLGDRVLGLIIAKKLLEIYPNEKEGILDKKFASLVNKKICYMIGKNLELEKHLKFYNEDYKNLVNAIPKEELEFDLIWCDLGGLEHYLVYQDLLLPMIANRGGYIIFPSTLSNVHGLAFLSQLKLKLNSGMLPNFELISLFEPQKKRQNSCTILRKLGGLSNRIYTERPWPLYEKN